MDQEQKPAQMKPTDDVTPLFGWVIGPVFLALGAWIFFVSPPGVVPKPKAELVSKDDIRPGARRTPMGDPPQVKIGGYEHACVECHRLFESPSVQHEQRVQHTDIQLHHGMNANCFNCHDRRDRSRLVLYTGTTIGFDEVPRLCSQCHGTVFRDWQKGMHGKTMGSWDETSGKQYRLKCNECHDPHSPAYPKFTPLPPPNTLRMGEQLPYGSVEDERHRPLMEGAENARHPKRAGEKPGEPEKVEKPSEEGR